MTELGTETFRSVGRSDDIPNDSVEPYHLADRKMWISIARIKDRLYAFDDLCTHEGYPLSGGLLAGTTITCQCHGSRFDITTGTVINGPASEALRVYEVRVVEGNVQIRLRDACPRLREVKIQVHSDWMGSIKAALRTSCRDGMRSHRVDAG